MIRAEVDIRDLDQTIRLQRWVDQRESGPDGDITGQWTDVATVRAKVDSARVNNIAASIANEQVAAGQIHAARSYTIYIRWRSDLDSSMRIVWAPRGQERIFEIKGIVDNGKRGRFLVIFVYEGLSPDGQ